MKRLSYFIIAAAIGTVSAMASPANENPQDTKTATEQAAAPQKESKAERKARKKAEKEAKKREEARRDSLEFEVATQAIENGHFVITADRLRFRRGRTANVNESTNFVMLQGDKATVQLAFERGFSGANGLGGFTVEGRASNIRTTYDKKGNLHFSMMVIGTAISADVSFTLPKNGSRCDAVVSSNFHAIRITFSGELHPYNTDNIYQGRTIR